MSFQRRSIVPNDRYNRLLKIADLDPLTYRYDEEIERGYGLYLDQKVKEDFLTQVSILANERLQTHDIRTRQGKYWGQTFTLVVGQPIRIDFLEPHNSTGTVGAVGIGARQAVWLVRIVNKGTGDLLYSLNVHDNGSALLPSGGTTVHEATVERYEAINLQATGSNAVVNVAIEI